MMEWVVLAVFVVFYGILSRRSLVNGIAVLLLLLPFYRIRFEIGVVPVTLIEVMVLVLFGLFVVKRIQNRKRITFSNYKWLMVALLFFVTVGLFFVENRIGALGVWKAYFVEPLMFFVVFINVIKKRKDLNLVFKSLALSVLGVSLLAIYQKITGQFIPNELWAAEETRRVTSIYGYPNAIGLYLAPLVVLLTGWGILGKSSVDKKDIWRFWKSGTARGGFWKSWRFWRSCTARLCGCIAGLFGLLAIWFARSEGALVAVAVGFLFLGLLIKRLRVVTLVSLVLLGVVFLAVPQVNELVMEKATFGDFSGNLRLIMWQESYEMLKDNVLWGAGLSGYQSAIAPYHHAINVFEIYMYPHNLLLNVWSETGILGLLVFVGLIIKFFGNYLKVRMKENKELYIVLMCAFATLLTHGIVDVPYFKNDLSILWWLLFGLSWVVLRSRKKLV